MSATTCRVCNERVIGNTHECPKELRERCEKYVKYHCHCPSPSSCDCLKVAVDNLESFAREIRNEALEEAAKVADKRTPEGMYHVPEVHRALQIGKDIRALAAKESSDG